MNSVFFLADESDEKINFSVYRIGPKKVKRVIRFLIKKYEIIAEGSAVKVINRRFLKKIKLNDVTRITKRRIKKKKKAPNIKYLKKNIYVPFKRIAADEPEKNQILPRFTL